VGFQLEFYDVAWIMGAKFKATHAKEKLMRSLTIAVSAAVSLLAASTRADDGITSGPEIGKKVPALKVYAVTGAQEDKEIDYASERKDKPTIYLFVQADKWSRPMARFMKALEAKAQKESKEAYIVAIWLTEKPDATKEYLPRAQQSLQFEATALTCFAGDKAGPKGWGINADAHLTAVVANKGKVVVCFGYMSVNETDTAKVQAALKKALAVKK
jgi:hypothetical protein